MTRIPGALLVGLLGLFATPAAHAQPRWGVDLSLGLYNLNAETATPQGIGSHAFGVGLGAHLLPQKYIRLDAGMLFLVPGDHESFTVTVIDEYGNVSERTASAIGVGLFGEAGAVLPFGDIVRGELNLGIMGVWADRSVANCADCPHQKLDVPGGAYIKPRLLVRVSPDISLGVEYSHFLGGRGLSNGVMIFLEGERPFQSGREPSEPGQSSDR